ncbi:hypothetical protein MaudCBS49596_004799 [Microsporum audouinii]
MNAAPNIYHYIHVATQDNAGKTTLLYRLKIGEVVTTIPTIGFNVESVTYKNLNFNVWDLGGQTSIRPYWRCYYANTAAVIFVIDSTDIERLGTASDELAAMLNEEELREAALLVFANKQDQPGAKGAGEISEALKLGELRDRNWSIVACSAIDGKGINEGMDWLVIDIKANNTLVDQEDGKITDVRLGDIEDAAIVPEGSEIAGRQLGNWMWRSPESHAEGPLNSPSDIFSFAIVCIYAVHKKVIFAVDESELGEGEEKLARVIERQISFFADQDSIQEFLHHIRESPWAEIFRVIRDGFNKENPRRPFALWKGVDPVFKDLVLRMTHFNPDKRITAREALAHEWFKGI